MKKHMISDDYYYTKSRDRIGGTIRTDVFKRNDAYEAFSSYWQDKEEKVVGYGKADDDEQAGQLSRKDLRREWEEELKLIASTTNENTTFEISDDN